MAEHLGERELANDFVRGVRDHDGVVLRTLVSGRELMSKVQSSPKRLTAGGLGVRTIKPQLVAAHSHTRVPDMEKESRHDPLPPRINRVAMMIQSTGCACLLGTIALHFVTEPSRARPVGYAASG